RKRRAASSGIAARRSPAGHTHMAGDCGPVVAAVDDEIVTLRLAADRFADRRFDGVVAFRLPERRAQIGGILLPEAHIERAGAGQPDAIAAFAEIVGQRGDEAEPPAGLAHRDIARRAAGTVIAFVERPAPLQPGADERE